MAGREHAQRLPRELGERIGLAGLGLDADGHVALGLDEVLVGLDVDDRTGVLPLYAHLGRPGGGGETALYRAMLDANLFWRGPGGATLAREGGSGGLVLQRRCPIAGMDLAQFEALLKDFVDAAEGWTRRVAATGAPAAPAGMGPGADVALAGRYA